MGKAKPKRRIPKPVVKPKKRKPRAAPAPEPEGRKAKHPWRGVEMPKAKRGQPSKLSPRAHAICAKYAALRAARDKELEGVDISEYAHLPNGPIGESPKSRRPKVEDDANPDE